MKQMRSFSKSTIYAIRNAISPTHTHTSMHQWQNGKISKQQQHWNENWNEKQSWRKKMHLNKWFHASSLPRGRPQNAWPWAVIHTLLSNGTFIYAWTKRNRFFILAIAFCKCMFEANPNENMHIAQRNRKRRKRRRRPKKRRRSDTR